VLQVGGAITKIRPRAHLQMRALRLAYRRRALRPAIKMI